MPRPKSVSDREVLRGAARVIGRRGAVAFTLREVGDEVGLSAATLIQRYRTKRGLLLAIAADGAAALDEGFDEASRRHPSRLDAVVEALAASARSLSTPQEMANHLEFLQLDLRDPEFRRLTVVYFERMRARVRALLEEAVAERELSPHADPGRLAWALEVAYNGALVTWAVHRDEELEDALRRALAAVLVGGGGPTAPARVTPPSREHPPRPRRERPG